MIRTNLRYHRPARASEVSELLAARGATAAVLGGGTVLLPRMTRNERIVEHLVDIAELDLDRVQQSEDGTVTIGARVTYSDIQRSALARRAAPLLVKMADGVTGGRQLLQQATVVGSICQNFPGSDAPGAAAALHCEVVLHGVDGERVARVDQVTSAAERITTRPGEFVTAIRFPAHDRAGYHKIKHSTGSWPIATASAMRTTSGDIEVTLGAVHGKPLRFQVMHADEVESHVARCLTDPLTDVLAPGSYRRPVAPVAARRAIYDLLGDQR